MLVGAPINSEDEHTAFDRLQTLSEEVLQLSSRVGEQWESSSARGVTAEMVDDLKVGFETLRADVAFLKHVSLTTSTGSC